jgi:FAD/FMN-containing dehydrogenase
MTADLRALQQAIDGEVVLPGSADYDSVRKPVMARFEHVRPTAIVRCATPEDVAATLAVAGRLGLPTAIRSGGHSVAGRSSTDGIVLDVRPIGSVAVAGEVATVGGGVRLGELYVADGRVVESDEHHDGELFWGLRGAGGGHFGVVTSLVFRTLPAPAVTVFQLTWPPAAAAAVVQAWQAWAPDAPVELDATLRLTAAGDGTRRPGVEVVASVLDGQADATELLGELVDRVGADPVAASRRHLPHRAAKRYLEGLGSVEDRRERLGPEQPPRPDHLYTRSEFFRRPLPGETVAALIEHLTHGVAPGQSREVDFLPWGGAYNRVPADATAFVHRAERFLVQHLVIIGADAAAAERGAARTWLARSWALVHPWGSGGVYPNFPDPDLQDWARAYHGTNYGRLRRIKATYDPGGLFRFRQSLP